jgi:hypothetical protein
MAKLSEVKRIRSEDYPGDFKEFAGKLGFLLNPFLDQLVRAFNRNITISDNLNQEIRNIDITVNVNGVPERQVAFQKQVLTRTAGITVIRAFNRVQPNAAPVSAPFVTFTDDGQVINITNCKGLEPGVRYTLTLHVIGF